MISDHGSTTGGCLCFPKRSTALALLLVAFGWIGFARTPITSAQPSPYWCEQVELQVCLTAVANGNSSDVLLRTSVYWVIDASNLAYARAVRTLDTTLITGGIQFGVGCVTGEAQQDELNQVYDLQSQNEYAVTQLVDIRLVRSSLEGNPSAPRPGGGARVHTLERWVTTLWSVSGYAVSTSDQWWDNSYHLSFYGNGFCIDQDIQTVA